MIPPRTLNSTEMSRVLSDVRPVATWRTNRGSVHQSSRIPACHSSGGATLKTPAALCAVSILELPRFSAVAYASRCRMRVTRSVQSTSVDAESGRRFCVSSKAEPVLRIRAPKRIRLAGIQMRRSTAAPRGRHSPPGQAAPGRTRSWRSRRALTGRMRRRRTRPSWRRVERHPYRSAPDSASPGPHPRQVACRSPKSCQALLRESRSSRDYSGAPRKPRGSPLAGPS